MTKVRKEEADYTPKGTKSEHCGICTHFQPTYAGKVSIIGNCERVTGKVVNPGWCTFFERIRKAA